MTAMVITGGRVPTRHRIEGYLHRSDLICACDSGLDAARRLEIEPDLVVGDMDSLSSPELLADLPAERVLSYPSQKAETDTEIGIRTSKEHGASNLILVGGGGGRLDHLLGIISILHRDSSISEWLTADDHATQITRTLVRDDLRGARVSFFPLAGTACTMETNGLRWPLDSLSWSIGDAGVSNVVVSDRLSITMLSGRLLMVQSYGD